MRMQVPPNLSPCPMHTPLPCWCCHMQFDRPCLLLRGQPYSINPCPVKAPPIGTAGLSLTVLCRTNWLHCKSRCAQHALADAPCQITIHMSGVHGCHWQCLGCSLTADQRECYGLTLPCCCSNPVVQPAKCCAVQRVGCQGPQVCHDIGAAGGEGLCGTAAATASPCVSH
jgi:hypothetical protein